MKAGERKNELKTLIWQELKIAVRTSKFTIKRLEEILAEGRGLKPKTPQTYYIPHDIDGKGDYGMYK